ncbi:MAG: hypothetical protein QNJ04_05145 [Desulfobacterales bacterium]|nr:hypothetical protein [Desulfobacterales bacterium]
MNVTYREIKPGKKPVKRAYLAVMLWFMGRAVQAASRVDRAIMDEVADLPDDFVFALGVAERGPWMVVGRRSDGALSYRGRAIGDDPVDLKLAFKHLEAGFLTFTFRENTPVATARDRLNVDGEVAHACAVVRIIDRVQVYLLPKPLARLAVKRYPRWPLLRKCVHRTRIYWRALLGY